MSSETTGGYLNQSVATASVKRSIAASLRLSPERTSRQIRLTSVRRGQNFRDFLIELGTQIHVRFARQDLITDDLF